MKNKNLISLFLLLLGCNIFIDRIQCTGEAGVPLSICGTASCVPNDGLNKLGACQIDPTDYGYYPASISSGAFSGGKRCGECFRLTGPSGTVVVMAYDTCATEQCMQSDGFHFIIPRAAYQILTNNTDPTKQVGNIYSLGYQEVACELGSENIKVKFNGGQSSGVADYQYYFTVQFITYTVGIERVTVLGTGMSSFQDMTLNLGGLWTWNKKDVPGEDSKLVFPIKLTLTAFDGSSLMYYLPSKPKPNVFIDTDHQFAPEPHPNATNKVCLMGMVPEFIFQDKIPYGWSTSYSWDILIINTTIDPGNQPSLNEHVIQTNCSSTCGLVFQRDGGFQTEYIASLKFVARADPPTSSIKVFFGDQRYEQVGFISLTADWQNFTIPISDMAATAVESLVTFQNMKATPQTMYFDNIKWEFKEGAPETPAVVVDTTTAFPTMRPLTSTGGSATTGGGLSSSSTGLSGSIPGVTSAITDNISTNGEQTTGSNSNSNSSSSLSFNLLLILSLFIITILNI